jgi:hypothetical protein
MDYLLPVVERVIDANSTITIADNTTTAETAEELAFLRDLKTGQWRYPNTKVGDINISVWFDMFLFGGLLCMWLAQTFIFGQRPPLVATDANGNVLTREHKKENVVTYCLKGAKLGSNPLTAGVEFITKDEYSIMLGTATMISFVFFKIIGGAENVSSGYAFVIVLCALFTRFTRQAGKGRVWFMLNTVIALVAVLLAFLSYTRSIPGGTSSPKPNAMYIISAILVLISLLMKLILTIIPRMATRNIRGKTTPNNDAYEVYLRERAYAIVDGEWLYEMTGTSCMIVGGALIVFTFTMAITVALGATKWYAVPFFALYAIPVCQVGALAMQGGGMKNIGPIIFNSLFLVLGTFILVMLHAHACSLPSSVVTKFATGSTAYCPRFGGLLKSTTHGLKLAKAWTIVLELSTALFIVMAYCSMVFTALINQKTVEHVCSAETRMSHKDDSEFADDDVKDQFNINV